MYKDASEWLKSEMARTNVFIQFGLPILQEHFPLSVELERTPELVKRVLPEQKSCESITIEL